MGVFSKIGDTAGGMAHRALLKGAGASASAHMLGGAAGGAVAGALGSMTGIGPTGDDGFIGGTVHGAMIGAAGGAAFRAGASRYGASMAAEVGAHSFGGAAAADTFKFSRFTSDAAKANGGFFAEPIQGMTPKPILPENMAGGSKAAGTPPPAPSANTPGATATADPNRPAWAGSNPLAPDPVHGAKPGSKPPSANRSLRDIADDPNSPDNIRRVADVRTNTPRAPAASPASGSGGATQEQKDKAQAWKQNILDTRQQKQKQSSIDATYAGMQARIEGGRKTRQMIAENNQKSTAAGVYSSTSIHDILGTSPGKYPIGDVRNSIDGATATDRMAANVARVREGQKIADVKAKNRSMIPRRKAADTNIKKMANDVRAMNSDIASIFDN